MKFNIQHQLSKTERINFSGAFSAGERIALLGKSGAGKTTLLRYLAGLATKGSVQLEFGSVINPKPWQSPVVLLHQQPVMFPTHTVQQSFNFAQKFAQAQHSLPLNRWLEQLELTELLNKNCLQLSGGQAQRVALVRALLSQAQWLLLDEPMSALDAQRTTSACDVLAEYCKITGAGLVLASHNDTPQRFLCDQAYEVDQLSGQKTQPLFSALNHQLTEPVVSTLTVKAAAIEHGLLKTQLAEQTLYLAEPQNWQAGHARISIAADDVSIAIAQAHETSMVNRIAATLVKKQEAPLTGGWQLTLKVAEQELRVNVSKWSYERLKLEINQRVFAEFKVGAVYWSGQAR